MLLRSFWLWFLMFSVSWTCAVTESFKWNNDNAVWYIFMTAVLFLFYFLVPVFHSKPYVQTGILIIVTLVATVALWTPDQGEPNLYALLLYALIGGEAVYRLPIRGAVAVGVFLWAGACMNIIFIPESYSIMYLVLAGLLITIALTAFRSFMQREESESARSEALLSEYRRLKRQLASAELEARQAERTQVARDLHDSVGHKLTALLMQIEVVRMQATEPQTAEQLAHLKQLAKESLEDTRSAVKELKLGGMTGGLSGVMALIKKLEAESLLRVNFTVKHGAMSAPLSSEQSVAVYRAVQEALTNMMRHSGMKEADVLFEFPGGGAFCFEVSNPLSQSKPYREGFGLKAMRERMREAGGELEVSQEGQTFVVRGKIPLYPKGMNGQ
ncbi:sensor histidine kinase [Paenibacillus sp. GCM10027627]|uniref:sensor histidine kinase n=1 Tax=unclassified Paenibacillus TaxID=185978 RepID=UPI0036358F9D